MKITRKCPKRVKNAEVRAVFLFLLNFKNVINGEIYISKYIENLTKLS
jgi:hypothetical protein